MFIPPEPVIITVKGTSFNTSKASFNIYLSLFLISAKCLFYGNTSAGFGEAVGVSEDFINFKRKQGVK